MLPLTDFVIAGLCIIAHMDTEQRKDVFLLLKKTILEESKKYEKLLAYFERNWLAKSFIDHEDTAFWNRTNNICEGFNSFLSKQYFFDIS